MKSPSRSKSISHFLASLVLAGATTSACQAAPIAQQRFMAISINGQPAPTPVVVLEGFDARLYLPEHLFSDQQLRISDTQQAGGFDLDGQRYLPLDGIAGMKARVDETQQTLFVEVPPQAYQGRMLDLSHPLAPTVDDASPGAMVNYDVYYAKAQTTRNVSALLETGLFHDTGVLLNRQVLQQTNGQYRSFRLDTSFTYTSPTKMAALTLGDSVSTAGNWSRPVYFGGLQWRTNFATRPNFQPVALPAASGVASAPSVVDVYVDNVLRSRQNVDTGPFALNNLPIFSGQGTVQLVVRDVLGRQQVISQPYLASPYLLRPGVNDFGFQTGRLRRGYGSPDSRYGAYFASGTIRQGMTHQITVESHLELEAANGGSASVGIAAPVAGAAVISTGVALGKWQGSDYLAYAQLDRATRGHGFSVRLQMAGSRFRQIGMAPGEAMPAEQLRAQWSTSLRENASLNLALTSQNNRTNSDFHAVSAGVTRNLSGYSTVSIGATRSLGRNGTLLVTASLIVPFGRDGISLVNASRQKFSQVSGEYQSLSHADTGWTYRLRQTSAPEQSSAVGLTYQGYQGAVSLGASHAPASTAVTAQARGSIVHMAGHTVASRWLDGSFAMVKVPTRTPVTLYANNRIAGQTDSRGVALIPNLQPYVGSPISLDASLLGLDVEVRSQQQTVTPAWRTGHVLNFDMRTVEAATVVLTDANGKHLAAGTRVTYGMGKDAEVGLRGEIFLQEVTYPLRLVAGGKDGGCQASVMTAPDDRFFPRIGPIVCTPGHL